MRLASYSANQFIHKNNNGLENGLCAAKKLRPSSNYNAR